MRSVILQFHDNIKRSSNLGLLHVAMKDKVTGALDISDLLRAQLALTVSAVDHYIHEIVRLGMIEVIKGGRNNTPAFKRFGISLECAITALNNPDCFDWLDEEVRFKHSFKSFQQADKIAEAIRLISDVALWDEVAARIHIPARDIKAQLNLIVDRRNKIAHEADMDPSFPGSRWGIDSDMVDQSTAFLVNVIQAIDQIVNP